MNLNNVNDTNALRKLMQAGLISPQDFANRVDDSSQTISGSFGPTNALAAAVNPGPQDGSQGQVPQTPVPQDQNFVRNESTGQTMYLGPNGPQDIPYSRQLQGQVPQSPMTNGVTSQSAYTGPHLVDTNAPQGQMRVIGAGNGTVADLGTEPAQRVALDSRRGQIEIPGVGRADYGTDGNAYIRNGDGSLTKVLLGYDMAGSMALNKANLENEAQKANIAKTYESIRASKIQNPDLSNMGVGGAGGPQIPLQSTASASTGNTVVGADGLPQTQRNEAFLQTLDPQIAAQVKAYADGRLPIPAGFALKSPYFQNMLRLVGQYDPSFDFVNANARNKTRQSFTAGPDAANVTALNTAIYHLGTLKDAYDKLNNSRFPTYNAVANTLGEEFGNQGVQAGVAGVNANAQAVAEELAKVFRSQGMSESEVNAWKSKLNTNSAPGTSNETINEALNLMDGRLQALADKYNSGMGTTADPMMLLKPRAQQVLQRLRASVNGQAQPAQQSAPQGNVDPLVVTAPDGSQHRFPTPQQADAFRKAIGQ